MYKRLIFDLVIKRFSGTRHFIQVLAGPRQTGKTTIAKQLISEINLPTHYASADEPILKDNVWIEQQWETARVKIQNKQKRGLLILDEIQKVHNWAEVVKRLWDEDSFNEIKLHVLILGSSQLLLQKGLTESLAGRFEVIPITHWSFNEMQTAFGWDIDYYIFYGGYPGSVSLIKNNNRWVSYIKNSLIETTISKDILLMTRVDKPALLTRLFELGCSYSGQILSYQKMLGQLQDAGNTVTLAYYLSLLENAGLLAGLSKYAGQKIRQRASSPKFQVLNTALLAVQSSYELKELKEKNELWGRFVESCIGASLYNAAKSKNIELYYWNESNYEVDFVLKKGDNIIAIEIKSGMNKQSLPGMNIFEKKFKVKKKLLIGTHGIPVKDFLAIPVENWFR